MSEKFCLKWNDFNCNASKSFGLLRNEEYLHDVTLVSDDQTQVSAHKLVLSACSEYFKNIFKHNNKPNAHPLLCLDGVSSEDLKNIMDYIYNGEVNIFQESLDRFLSVAQRLKLEGLMGNDDTEHNQEQEVSAEAYKGEGYAKEEHIDTDNVLEASSSISTPRSNQRNHKSKEVSSGDRIVVPVSSEDIREVRQTVQQYMETDADGNLKCTICGKEAVGNQRGFSKRNLENHIETHLEGLSYPCQICGKTFRSKNSFFTHKTRFHKEN